MKKILLMTGVACLVATSASAFEFNPYVAAKAKYVFARYEEKATGSIEGKSKLNDDVWGASVAAGTTYNLLNGDFRFELEYTKNADAEKKQYKIKTQAALFNVYYDFDLKTAVPLKPYIGAGLGWGRTELERNGKRVIKNNGAAAQIGAGVNYKLCDHMAVDLGYRYISYGDFDKEYRVGYMYEKVDYKPHAHELLLGIRYEF